MAASIKDQVQLYFDTLFDPKRGGVKNPDRSNSGKVLFELFVLNELSKRIKDEAEALWARAAKEKLIESDDDMRKRALGEHIIAESDHFSLLATLSSGRKTVDKPKLIANVAKRFRVSEEAIEELWDASQKVSAPSLSKRILEAS